MIIESEQSARKLARTIMSDITLYNSDKIARSANPQVDLASELAEGRALFRSRVAPSLHGVFEEQVQASASRRRR